MKRGMAWIMAILLGSVALAGAEGAPVFMSPEPVYEFSPVLEGSEVVHDFIVRNTGTAELVIDRVKTG